MHRQIYKKAFACLVLALVVNVASSTKQESSGWKKVVSDFTSVASNFGLREANKPCIEYLRDDNTCMKEWKQGKLWRIVEENKVPILECNAVSMEDIHHVCQLKTWFVILIILLILIICSFKGSYPRFVDPFLTSIFVMIRSRVSSTIDKLGLNLAKLKLVLVQLIVS